MRDFRLLIHHHTPVHQTASGDLFLASFIGRWINALSGHVGQIGLLSYQTPTHLIEQDEMITARNVKLWSLGAPGKTWDRFPRIKRLKQVCSLAAQSSDGLLIRGVTPRQFDIWRATDVPHKAFLLVGSLLQSRPVFRPTFWGIYEFLMPYWRKHEVLEISKQGTLLANSPLMVAELATLNRSASFVPTNSIRADEFSAFEVRRISNPPKILFCSRIVPEKGVRELFEAVAQAFPARQFELDMVGTASEAYRQELDGLASSLGIAKNVQWHGRIPYGPGLFAFYCQADVFVLPTYYEGFPHVLWEAAAHCCPIITTAVGGIPAFLENEREGLLVLPRNSAAISDALRRVLHDDALRASIVKKAYTLAQGYTVESCAGSLADFLSQHWQV